MSNFQNVEYPSQEQILGVSIETTLHATFLRHEVRHGYFTKDLRDEAVNAAVTAALDKVFGNRCPGCGDRGPDTSHGPGACV